MKERSMVRRILLSLVLVAAPVDAADYVLFPGFAGTVNQSFSTSANEMRCARYVALTGKSGATKIAMGITGAVTSGTCGGAIYEDSNSGAQLAETVGPCTSTGIVSDTVSSFTITEGATYRVCTCSSGTTGSYLAVSSTASAGYLADLMTEFAAGNGIAAEVCVSGDPPPTTGAITSNTGFRPPIVLVE